MSCQHSSWLGVYQPAASTAVYITDRVTTLAKDVPRQNDQHPVAISFVGGKERAEVVRRLFAIDSAGSELHGQVHVHLLPSAAAHRQPTFLIEGDFIRGAQVRASPPIVRCHRTRIFERNPSQWPHLGLRGTFHDLYARVVAPFTNVF